ncbi:MAG: hypothetical protein J6N45_01715 [Alphaproteobacteria bacterium]|nr:hypothetical protein [Alphaproteobacteria bacterium]
MKVIQNLKNFLQFKGNVGRVGLFCLIFGIELFRVSVIEIYAHLSLPSYRIISLLTDFPLMLCVLYLYAAAIAGRLHNLKLNPKLAYFWVLGVWCCKYLFLPLAHSTGSMQFVYSACALFMLILLPLFAENKNKFLFAEYTAVK